MNHELFLKWFQEKLLPNIPQKSLIIMDNASYHNVLSNHSAPVPNSKKLVLSGVEVSEILTWLNQNKIPVSDDCLKSELIEIINKIAPNPTYVVDEIASKQGHKILRTPPYHPELQPIEICWGIVKNEISRNCDFTMENLLIQLDEAFSCVTSNTCSGLMKKIRKIEDDFWYDDLEIDSQLE